MNYNENNTTTHRQCYRCSEVKELNSENFYPEKSRPQGFAYLCKRCDRSRPKKPRKCRWALMTNAQRAAKKKANYKYNRTSKAKSVFMASSYRKTDKDKGRICNLTSDWLLENIMNKACSYCGTTDDAIGCDRIDNSKGHAMDNVIPACGLCNKTRADNFSVEEMRIIGGVIKTIRATRKAKL